MISLLSCKYATNQSPAHGPMPMFRNVAAAAALWLGGAAMASAGTLVINADTSDPAPKAAFEAMIAKFEKENPDVEVKFNVFDHEGFKNSIRNFLTSQPPDVVTWYAGERMRTFVDRGLFEDVSDLWEADGLTDAMASSLASMTVDGKQWGVPYTYYQWGVYYRRDIFDKYGLSPPTNWEEMLQVGKTLNENGVRPFTIGTKFLWTAAGWFDYLNLRINGLPFHMELAAGKVPWTDDRIRKVFEYWAVLLENDFYIDNHASYSWQEAQPFLLQGQAAMYLIGNFIVPFFNNTHLAGQMGFFQFPVIDESVPMYEDAPTDTVHIPAKARNKEDARKFLAFMARADNQTEANGILGQLPTNSGAEVGDDPFLQQGFAMLNASAGMAQFFDRDMDPEMAKIGMKGFQEFMVRPDRLDRILERLEKARQRIYK